jgi:hypothetical protein
MRIGISPNKRRKERKEAQKRTGESKEQGMNHD